MCSRLVSLLYAEADFLFGAFKVDFKNFSFNFLTDFKNTLLALKNDRKRVREVGIRASHSIVRSWESVAEEVVGRYNDIISAQKLIQILK